MQQPPQKPLFSRRERALHALAVLAVLLAAAGTALRWELAKSEHAFGLEAHNVSLQVARRLAEGRTLMSAVHGMYQGAGGLAGARFPSVVRRFVDAHPQVHWVGFAERIGAGEEPRFEKRLLEEGYIGLRVQPFPGSEAMPAAAWRLPLYRLEPLTPRFARLLGVDLVTRAEWRAAAREAVDSGEVRATITRAPEMGLEGIVLLRAVYRGHVEPEDSLSRQQQLAGMLLVFLDSQALIAGLPHDGEGLWVRLPDAGATRTTGAPGALPVATPDRSVHASVFPMAIANLKLPLEVRGAVHPNLAVVAVAVLLAGLFCMSVLHGLRLQRTARREEELAFVQAQLAQVTLHCIGEAVVRLDTGGRVRYLNPVARSMSALGGDAAIGLPLEEVLRIESDGMVTGATVSGLRERHAKVALHMPSGQRRALACTLSGIDDGHGHATGTVLILRDVTREDELSRELAYQASHDPLTDLPNRREFERRLARALAQAHDGTREHALFYVDLDQFKLVNDTCGHAAGDRMLRQIAGVLAAEVRDGDVLARLGGDEFGVLLDDCAVARALPIAERICQAVSRFRFIWDGRAFELGASIGVVGIDATAGTVDDVQRAADLACYAAKDTGRNRVHLYQREDRVISRNHREMQWHVEIKEALVQNRFVLHGQRIRPLHGTTRVGAMHELLLRMVDADGSLVPPMAFLPAAERYGLMTTLDRTVIEQAFGHVARLAAPGDVYNINLSGQSLTDPGLGAFILDLAARAGIHAGHVCFEVTETSAISNLALAGQLMAQLRAQGFRFALDDFGAGLSSFGYLKQLPVDFIKIDGQFVREVTTDPVARAMVASIISVARVLELETVGEKVEDESVERCLRSMGVDYAQGFHVGRPRALAPVVELARSA